MTASGAPAELRWVRISDPLARPVLAGLAEEYRVRYGSDDELRTTTAEEFDPPGGRFAVVVTAGGETLAAGGYRRLDAVACEVKRMWTRADHRRRGLAGLVLSSIEASAAGAGYRLVRLETGPAQPEAVGLYESLGYRRIDPFGRYPRALAFEKPLPAPETVAGPR